MSEQASEKVELADHQPGASTFPGTPTSGGWVPILAQSCETVRPFRIDWLCPRCGRLTANYNVCPGCGLLVLESPKKKDPLPDRMKHYQYRKWAMELFDGDEDTLQDHRHRPRSSLRRPHGNIR